MTAELPKNKQCEFCHQPAEKLCDYRLDEDRTCDAKMCRRCAFRWGHLTYSKGGKRRGDTIDYCPDHVPEGNPQVDAAIFFEPEILELVVHGKRDDYDKVIDRRTSWGNPFPLADYFGNRAACLFEYVTWLSLPDDPKRHDPLWHPRYKPTAVLEHVHLLDGKRLACWCAPKLCHGHVLASLASVDNPREELERLLEDLAPFAGDNHGSL